MSTDDITLPWIDEPMDVEEAVEALAQASVDDGEHLEELEDRIERLEHRVGGLVDGSSIECPECESVESVYKAGVGAARLANDGNLSEKSADALNKESHVCLDCRESFTPSFE
ncbi:MAG: hypothetical protein QXG03_09140 [Halalkalicoccus sp.]